jgi:hypothetical protein
MNNNQVTERIVERDEVGDQVVERTAVETKDVRPQRAINKTIQILFYVQGVIFALLGLRIILRLLGASQGSSFVNLIYGITYPLVYPFLGMFRTQWTYGAARLEYEAIVAIIVYGILFWIIANFFRLGK